jgi:beta-lactamase class A
MWKKLPILPKALAGNKRLCAETNGVNWVAVKPIFFAALLAFAFAAEAQTQTAPLPPASTPMTPRAAQSPLDAQIQNTLEGFQGKVWIYAKNLDTGYEYGLRADELVRTASTIKLPIMAATFDLVEQGKLRWSDEVVVTKEAKKGGSGVLRELSDGTKIDLRSAVNFMIVVSDNTGTNLVLDRVTCDGVNAYMDTLGLKQTRSLRHVFGGGEAKAWDDPKMKPFGLAVSSPKEMVRLLEMLEKGEVVSKQASSEMLGILKRQQLKDGIGRNLVDVESASKSGALDRLRSDVGILYTKGGRIAMAITVDEMPEVSYTPDNPGLHLIWKLSQVLQTGLSR